MVSTLTEIHRVIGRTCWLALVLGMLTPAIGQEGDAPPPEGVFADAPAVDELSFEDLYPDLELPSPDNAVTIDKSPTATIMYRFKSYSKP